MGIFDGVRFAVVHDLVEDAQKIKQDLVLNGAIELDFVSNPGSITHLISNSTDFPEFMGAHDAFVHVVTSSWVSQSILDVKLLNPRHFSPERNLIFADVVVALASNIPTTEGDAITLGVVSLGGQHTPRVNKAVTHVIASSIDNEECQLVIEKNLRCIPVLPNWFYDCLEHGRLIDATPYRLPNPSYLEEQNPILRTCEVPSSIEASDELDSQDLEIGASATDGVFSGKNVFLDRDYHVSDRLRHAFSRAIQGHGGRIVQTMSKADILICQFRESKNFALALEKDKTIGNLDWLYYTLRHKRLTNPTTKLTHYPVPQNGLLGLDTSRIAISNYTGDARTYLETLIKAAGATYTKTFGPENTLLITGHWHGEKLEAAGEWNVKVVNHLWLEESYAKQSMQNLFEPKYRDFSEGANPGLPLGQASIDLKVVRRSLPDHKRGRLENMGMSVDGASDSIDEDSTDASTFDASEDAESDADFHQASSTRARSESFSTADKENVSPGGRLAKSQALGKVQMMAKDMNLFQKQLKRKGGILHGGMSNDDIVTPKKRTSSESSGNEQEDGSDTERPRKKTKTMRTFRILVTGGTEFGWTDSKSRKLKRLGIRELNEIPRTKLSAVIAHKPVRTIKFLSAIALGAKVIKSDWLTQCLESKERISMDGWELEGSFDTPRGVVSLADARKRAQIHRANGGMMRNMTVYCTKNVPGGAEQLCRLVNCLGGKCVLFTGQETPQPPSKNPYWPESVFMISDSEDEELWDNFTEMALSRAYTPQVVQKDWLVNVAISQEPEAWLDEWLLEPSE